MIINDSSATTFLIFMWIAIFSFFSDLVKESMIIKNFFEYTDILLHINIHTIDDSRAAAATGTFLHIL